MEKNADGQLIASVRLLDTQFPFMMTVNTGRHTYRVVDFLFAMVVSEDVRSSRMARCKTAEYAKHLDENLLYYLLSILQN